MGKIGDWVIGMIESGDNDLYYGQFPFHNEPNDNEGLNTEKELVSDKENTISNNDDIPF